MHGDINPFNRNGVDQGYTYPETVYKGHPEVPKLFRLLLVPSALILFITLNFKVAFVS